MANRFFEDAYEKTTESNQSEENNAWAAVRKEQKDREESFWDQAKANGFSALQMEASLFLENLHGRNVSTNLFVCQKRSVEDSSRLVQSKYFDYLQVPLDFGKFDSYVSINNFKPKGRRTKADCTQINGFFFDMDCHDLEQEEIDVRIKRTLQALNCAVQDQVLPLPTMTTNSGRGLGVFCWKIPCRSTVLLRIMPTISMRPIMHTTGICILEKMTMLRWKKKWGRNC